MLSSEMSAAARRSTARAGEHAVADKPKATITPLSCRLTLVLFKRFRKSGRFNGQY